MIILINADDVVIVLAHRDTVRIIGAAGMLMGRDIEFFLTKLGLKLCGEKCCILLL